MGENVRVGARFERARRALAVTRVARRSGIIRVLAEIGAVGHRDATREGAQNFRRALEELGTTYIKLGQLLSSRPDLLPDVYIEELSHLVDEVPPVPFAEIDAVLRADFGDDIFVSVDPVPLATASIAQTHRTLLASGRRAEAALAPAHRDAPGSTAPRADWRHWSRRGLQPANTSA